jgi:hypothetical protein
MEMTPISISPMRMELLLVLIISILARKRIKINDIKRDVNLAINCYNDSMILIIMIRRRRRRRRRVILVLVRRVDLELEESWVAPSAGTRCSYASPTNGTAPNEIEEEKDCNKTKDKRRKRNDSKCCELLKQSIISPGFQEETNLSQSIS